MGAPIPKEAPLKDVQDPIPKAPGMDAPLKEVQNPIPKAPGMDAPLKEVQDPIPKAPGMDPTISTPQPDTPIPKVGTPASEAKAAPVPVQRGKAAPADVLGDLPAVPELSQRTLEKRIGRALAPTSKGYRVSEEVRALWDSGNKEKVFRLFAQCGNDAESFIKKFSAKKTSEKETEVGVFFDYRTEKDLESLPEHLFGI